MAKLEHQIRRSQYLGGLSYLASCLVKGHKLKGIKGLWDNFASEELFVEHFEYNRDSLKLLYGEK